MIGGDDFQLKIGDQDVTFRQPLARDFNLSVYQLLAGKAVEFAKRYDEATTAEDTIKATEGHDGLMHRMADMLAAALKATCREPSKLEPVLKDSPARDVKILELSEAYMAGIFSGEEEKNSEPGSAPSGAEEAELVVPSSFTIQTGKS